LAAQSPSLDWHVITEDGDLTARLRDGLTLGIDDQGLLRFNPGQTAALRFVAGGQGSLVIETVQRRTLLCHDDGDRRPSSILQAGEAARVIVGPVSIVLATDVAGALNRPGKVELALVDEPAGAAEDEAAAAAEPARESTPVGQAEPAAVPPPKPAPGPAREPAPSWPSGEVVADPLTAGPDDRPAESPRGDAAASAAPMQEDGPRLRRRVNAALLIGFAVFLALAISPRVRDTLPAPGASPAPPPDSSPIELPASGPAPEAAPPADGQAPQPTAADTPAVPDAEPEPAAAATASAPPASTRTSASQPALEPTPEPVPAPVAEPGPDPRLPLARRLLEQEDVITPPGRNAVEVLSEVLYDDPDNEEALQLMQRCADTLVADAQRALFRGDEFAARNLVEDVLAFHPTHGDANALWRRLTGTAAP